MNRQLMNEQMQQSQLGGNQDIFWKLHFIHSSLIYIFLPYIYSFFYYFFSIDVLK